MTASSTLDLERLLNAENRILEMIARGEGLESILEALCRIVEEFSTCSIASILLLNPDDNRLWYGAAPSLPQAYIDAFNGTPAGPGKGSCGVAIERREQVISADIATDPLWERTRSFVLSHGLRACWSSPIFSSTGAVLGTFAIHSRESREPVPRDLHLIDQITHLASIAIERAQALAAFLRNKEQLEKVQALSKTGSFTWRVSDGLITWSEETYRIYEYDLDLTPTIERSRERVHPEDRHIFDERTEYGPSENAAFEFEHRLLMPDGRVKYLRIITHPPREESGDQIEYLGAVSDITAQKEAAETIRKNARELREIVDAIPQLITVLAPDGGVLYVNKPALELTGLTAEEVQGDALPTRIIHQEDRGRVGNDIRLALTRGLPFESEYRILGKDGRHRWFLNHFNPLLDENGRAIRWYVTGTDIEDRKRAEERVREENIALRAEIDKNLMFEEIIGRSAELKSVLYRVNKVAPTDSTVLITGETGTGKELIARAIHKRSQRADGPFVTVNCAAFPPALVASELFGHEKGAFTGAQQRRIGRFEMAEGGTIFLDEVGELSMDIQVALLRVLQEREFERVGGGEAIRVDVRVVAATHRDLQALIVDGKFRSDLFYRLSVFPVELPPLRERADDIPLLVDYFLNHYMAKAGKRLQAPSADTMALLQAYPWPGNIRELQNVIERSVIVCESEVFTVDGSWLPQERAHNAVPDAGLLNHLSLQEKDAIEQALVACRGRVSGPSGAASRLGIPPSTLDSKIKSHKIDKRNFRGA